MNNVSKKRVSGFTLLELMIACVIFGILSSLAYSGYTSQQIQSRREAAKTDLVSLGQAMERQFTTTNNYEDGNNAAGDGVEAAPTIFATQSPSSGGVGYYDLFVATANNGSSYTLFARPSAGSPQTNDGHLELHSNGMRVWDRDNDGDVAEAADLCWEKTCL